MFTSSQLGFVNDGRFCPQLFTHTFVYRSRHRSSVDRTVCKKCVGRGGQKPSVYMVIVTLDVQGHHERQGKVWSLPSFWFSICSYKKQQVKKIWGRILDLAWLKLTVVAL